MPTFQSRPFRKTLPASSSALTPMERLGAKYRAKMNKHPFLMFGLPFISIMVLSSFLLTPATALRYELHDRKHAQLSKDEELELGLKQEGLSYNPRRRVIDPARAKEQEREEYYVRFFRSSHVLVYADRLSQRLMAKDIDDWDQKRIQRFKGEPDGRL